MKDAKPDNRFHKKPQFQWLYRRESDGALFHGPSLDCKQPPRGMLHAVLFVEVGREEWGKYPEACADLMEQD